MTATDAPRVGDKVRLTIPAFTVVEDRLVTTLSRYRLVEEEGS